MLLLLSNCLLWKRSVGLVADVLKAGTSNVWHLQPNILMLIIKTTKGMLRNCKNKRLHKLGLYYLYLCCVTSWVTWVRWHMYDQWCKRIWLPRGHNLLIHILYVCVCPPWPTVILWSAAVIHTHSHGSGSVFAKDTNSDLMKERIIYHELYLTFLMER